MKHCDDCGTIYEDNKQYCSYCGVENYDYDTYISIEEGSCNPFEEIEDF